MICPHCNKTIKEEQRYAMSRDMDSDEWSLSDGQIVVAFCIIAFVMALSLFELIASLHI